MVFYENLIWAIDSRNGYLLQIDPETDNTTILNTNSWSDFIGATGLAITDDVLWFTNQECVYCCSLIVKDFEPQLFLRLDAEIDGIAVWESTIYLTSQRQGKILVYDRQKATKITHFYAPGIGMENNYRQVRRNLADGYFRAKRFTVSIAPREKTIFSLLTPIASPTGLAFGANGAGKETLYIAYADREVYIRDNPNAEPNYELQYRDRTFNPSPLFSL